ncbi:MAG: substrate-binding domain-containing protein, partial [Anaerolineae bacterium]|nr:substrate-binding domain-containing protein [Anaerolineae bacterium]
DKDGYVVQLPAMVLERQVDAMVIVGAFFSDAVESLAGQIGSNIVLVDSYTPLPLFDSIVTDNVSGAVMAVSHLIENGHEHIGLIGSSEHSFPSIRERRQGYLEALFINGIAQTYIEEGDLQREDATLATFDLMQRAPQITAIFACNDDAAVGVLRALSEMNLRVPQDVSLVGFDGSELAQATNPTITSMAIDREYMGEAAVRMLRERAAFPQHPLVRVQVVPHLREGGSVCRR